MAERTTLFYRLVRGVCRLALQQYCPLHVESAENLLIAGSVLIASTHTATLDPVIVSCSFLRPMTFMAKAESFRFLPFAALIRALGAFPVRRGEPDRKALRIALNILREGRCLVIFLEGTRNPNWQLRPPELGVALLASWSGAPVLPAAISGSKKLTPKGKLIPRPTGLEVRVGKLLQFEGDRRRESLEQFAWQVMAALSELSGRPLARDLP